MSPSGKEEFPPLLHAGLHNKSIQEIEDLCVSSKQFALSKTRPDIMEGLKTIVNKIKEVGIIGDLWINGSFLTQKIDPEDVDIVLFLSNDQVENALEEQMEVLNWINENLKDDLRCDSYTAPQWPMNHPDYEYGQELHDYWLKWYSSSRVKAKKGIAVLNI